MNQEGESLFLSTQFVIFWGSKCFWFPLFLLGKCACLFFLFGGILLGFQEEWCVATGSARVKQLTNLGTDMRATRCFPARIGSVIANLSLN
jgi:hypothetical protein